MKTSDFFYELPQELIAQTPIQRRDASRLMTLDRASGQVGHHHFYELPDFLHPGDCLILNDSRVLPARLLGQRLPGGGACEVLLLIDRGEKTWECLVRPGRHMREGAKLLLSGVRRDDEAGHAAHMWRRSAHCPGDSRAGGRKPSGAL